MSGGSFDFLYLAAGDFKALASQKEALVRMAKLLLECAPKSRAAEETLRLLRRLDEIGRRSLTLRGVWKAAEWWESGDGSRQDVIDEIRKYEDISP